MLGNVPLVPFSMQNAAHLKPEVEEDVGVFRVFFGQ
jgi:hypothetical protein